MPETVKKLVIGSMVFAVLPLPLMTPNAQSHDLQDSVWETQLVLADTSPELLRFSDQKVTIEKIESRYAEEEARLAAERKAKEAKEAKERAEREEAERKAAAEKAAQSSVIAAADCNPTISAEEKHEILAKAAQAFGIPLQLLRAVHDIESGGRVCTKIKSYAGAQGPFQFMPGTWRGYAVDGNGDGVKNVNDMRDAAFGAAKLLAANGAAQGDLRRALFAYNHADWYVNKVLARM